MSSIVANWHDRTITTNTEVMRHLLIPYATDAAIAKVKEKVDKPR